MFLVDWCKTILASLSIWRKKGKILFLGLDNSGKTTLLKMLRDEALTQYAPTQHPTSEELNIGNLTLTAFDLGGHQIARRVWKDYFAKVDAVVYLVDAVDKERFPEAKKELHALLSDEELKDVPFLILGNKIDRFDQYAASEDELSWSLGLGSSMDPRAYHIRTGKGRVKLDDGRRRLEVFMCSVARKMGYRDGFEWVCQYIS